MSEYTKYTQSWICFQFLLNKLRAYAENSQSLTFESHYTPKVNFYAVCWHKQPPENTNNTILTSSVLSILKAMTNMFFSFFWTRFMGDQSFLFTRESTLGLTAWTWVILAGFVQCGTQEFFLDFFKSPNVRCKAQLLLLDSIIVT